jgi:hypothetical protein
MNDSNITPDRDIFDPDRWGLPLEAVEGLGDDLHTYWKERRACFRTRTHDGSLHAYTYLRGQLTVEDRRTFANMGRRLVGATGKACNNSPRIRRGWPRGCLPKSKPTSVAGPLCSRGA